MAKFKINLSAFTLIFLVSCSLASKLNVPRILLPIFSDFSTKFTLEAIEGGCYKWSTTRSDIVKIHLIDENEELGCASKVDVMAITKEDARNLAVVLAEDINADQVLKCDVIVDVIHNLTVTTTTRELFMEEVPEVFQVNAYDAQGNEFSTLEGVEFDWSIVTLGAKKDVTVLRYLPFKDSPYETPPQVQQLEEENKKGSMILLEGVKTGSAKVSVKFSYKEYKHVPTMEVVLTVIANLLLTPGESYVMVGDIIPFKLYYMNSGRMDEIKIPDIQYYLESEDNEIISSDRTSGEVTAVKLGKTKVVVHNANLNEEDPALKPPSAIIHVVEPAYMVLTILPYKNWAVLVGDQHEILVDVFSSSDHKLYLGPGVEIHTQVADAFHVEERSRNGSWMTGWGVKESRALVQASLEGIVHPKHGKHVFEIPIISQAELFIYPRITIIPAEVVLPWDPTIKPKYEVDLVAKGGDGRFLWSSTDHSLGLVSQTGHVRTLTMGHFDVSAAMVRNHHNRQIARFSILPPVRLEIVEFVMEAEIGTAIYLHVALYAEKIDYNGKQTLIPFTMCQDLPFQVRVSDSKFIHNKTAVIPPVGMSCANIPMVGTTVGTSKVTISYFQDESVMEDSVTISAYKPLQLVQPEQDVVLAVGSTANLLFSGGPRPQVGRQSDYQRIVISENEGVAQAEDVSDQYSMPGEDNTVVWILCRKLGDSSVKLMISNTPTVPNCKTRASIMVIRVICGKPRRIHLQPEIKIADVKSCPMDLSADRVVIPNNQDVQLDVIVQDELGRVFLNASSLLITWEARPKLAVRFAIENSVLVRNRTYGDLTLPVKSVQMLRAVSDVGLIEITATVVGYRMSLLKKFKITPEWPEFLSGDERVTDIPTITSTIGLFLVDDTVVTPNFTMIFNQPNIKKTVSVLHGSGYVELRISDDEIAKVNYVENTREIEITPLRPGEMTIQVVDLCLVGEPVFVTVKVVTVGRVEIVMTDKVEINHCIECIVRLYDEAETLLDISQITFVDLRHRMTRSIANIGRMPQNFDDPWPLGEVHFVMTGIDVGDSQITFSFDNNGQQVESIPVEFQVFPPLKLSPRNGTLLVGAALQLTIKGGPQPECHIEFSVHNASGPAVVAVTDLGIVVGKAYGSTKVTARSIGMHPRTGDKVVYSEDTIEIYVIKMTGVSIAAPLTKFKVGSTVPAWATGIPEQLSPLILASLDASSVSYDWYLEDSDVATFTDVFSTLGVTYKSSDKVAARITGLQPGKIRLGLNLTLSSASISKPSVVFYASVEMEVFEAVVMLEPHGMRGRSVLMAQNANLQLKTNLDSFCHMEYIIGDGNLGGTAVTAPNTTSVQNMLVTVSPTGVLQSYGHLGRQMLLVTATDEHGLKQSLTYVVEVKPVHYMMLIVQASWRIHLDSSLRVLPLGAEFSLTANFYDNIGNKFMAGPPIVKVRANRLDLLKVKQHSNNNSIEISTRKGGHTVLKVWSEGADKTADYVRVHAEEVVKPIVSFLVSGDIMCLWSPVVTKHLQIGHWTSSDTELIIIDPSIDLAFVVGHGEGNVMLVHPLHPYAPLRMSVLPVAEVVLYPDRQSFITNGQNGNWYRTGVVFRHRLGPSDKKNNLIQGWLCDKTFPRYIVPTPFRCYIKFTNVTITIDANSVFALKSGFMAEIGQYNCKITSIGSNNTDVSLLRTNISIWAVSEEGEIQSVPLEVPFIPSVYIKPIVWIGDDGQNVGELDVIGLPEVIRTVKVTPRDSSIIYTDKGYNVGPNLKRFRVHLLDYHPKFADSEEVMGITVTTQLINQDSHTIVKVSNKFRDDACLEKSPFFRFIQRYRQVIVIGVSMFVIFCITVFVYTRFMQPVVNVNVHPNRSYSGVYGFGGSPSQMISTNYDLARPRMSMAPRMSTVAPRMSISPRYAVSPNSSRSCVIHSSNCSCNSPSSPQDPVYGDVTSGSPELRRNRRFL